MEGLNLKIMKVKKYKIELKIGKSQKESFVIYISFI